MELTEYGPLAQSKAVATDQKQRNLSVAALMLIGLFLGVMAFMEQKRMLEIGSEGSSKG